MTLLDIPRDQWQATCVTFARQHRGWLVTLDLIDTRFLESGRAPADERRSLLAQDAPLQGLTWKRKDGEDTIVITVGAGDAEFTHCAGPVKRLYREMENAADQGLRIDDADGVTTLLEFRAAALPEALDGLATSEL